MLDSKPEEFSILSRKSLMEYISNFQQKCAICGKDNNLVIDHQHCFKSEELGVNGAGLVRGLLCRDCNLLEGKIWNNIKRFYLKNNDNPVYDRIEFLEKLISYYKNNIQNDKKILHYKEIRHKYLSKTEYNRLKSNKSLKLGEFRPKMRITKKLEKLLNDSSI